MMETSRTFSNHYLVNHPTHEVGVIRNSSVCFLGVIPKDQASLPTAVLAARYSVKLTREQLSDLADAAQAALADWPA